jgi:hypothetical protein
VVAGTESFPPSGWPHALQYRLPEGLRTPQLAHANSSADPHSTQNKESAWFSLEQLGQQIIVGPLSTCL